jgi:hypothetical protein
VTATILEMERIVVKTNRSQTNRSQLQKEQGAFFLWSFPATGFRMFNTVLGCNDKHFC